MSFALSSWIFVKFKIRAKLRDPVRKCGYKRYGRDA
jgi:hypothetical protein